MAEEATTITRDQEVDDRQEDNAERGPTQQFLTFTISGEEYGVEIMKVREIKGWTETTRLPNSPDFMKGVINLRGVVIPIFDLKSCFKMGNTIPHEKNVVIILVVKERLVGILVDAVSDILSVGADEVRPAPHMEVKVDAEFINGLISMDEKMVVLLDVDHLFDSETLDKVEQASKALGKK